MNVDELTGRRARCLACVALITSLPLAAFADELVQLKSVEQGWEISFLGPELKSIDSSSSKGAYRYFGKSDNGLFLSLHVEGQTPVTHQNSCMQAFHSQYRGNQWNLPAFVDQGSIQFQTGTLESLSYQAELNYQGEKLKMPNQHFYFELNGYCADLHFAAKPGFDTEHLSFQGYAEQIRNSLIKSTRTEMSRLANVPEANALPVASAQ